MTENSENVTATRHVFEGDPVPERIASSELFRGRREVVILHDGHEYRLRITKANKLILTK